MAEKATIKGFRKGKAPLKIVEEKLKFILEQTDTDTVKNIWLNLSKMYEINKDTALGGILFKATENKVLELTKNK